MKLEQFNKQYIYKSDKERFNTSLDIWELSKDAHIIDCNIRQVVTYEKYCSLFNISKFRKYNWFLVGSKIMFAKVYTWIF